MTPEDSASGEIGTDQFFSMRKSLESGIACATAGNAAMPLNENADSKKLIAKEAREMIVELVFCKKVFMIDSDKLANDNTQLIGHLVRYC